MTMQLARSCRQLAKGGTIAALLAGCNNGSLAQSALDRAGDQASRITGLWWFYFGILLGVFTLVLAAIMIVVALHWRAQERKVAEVPIQAAEPQHERRLVNAIGGATLLTVAILFVLLFADVFAGRDVSSAAPEDALVIRVTGHQWWWELRYESTDPTKLVRTANELHIPIGKPVKFLLSSTDVIHSFWVPNLHGKRDLIPGHPASTWFVARKPGTYYGQCAEFCGYQHAHMRLAITAEPAEQFDAWLQAQRQSAPEPGTDLQRRGRDLFLRGTCSMCHTVQGTAARATVGPDLTHIASRAWLGSGALPNGRKELASWIANPQIHKPGVRMPQHTLPDEDINALIDYLETLK